MDDATYEAQKARVQRLTTPWETHLGMRYLQEFRLQWHRDGADLDARGHKGAMAVTSVWWGYKTVMIEWDLSKVADCESDEALEYAVVHEFMHVFIQQVVNAFNIGDTITDLESQHVERTATELAQAFLWVREATLGGKLPALPEELERAEAGPVFIDAAEGGP